LGTAVNIDIFTTQIKPLPMKTLFILLIAGFVISSNTQAQSNSSGINSIHVIPAEPTEADEILLVIDAVLPHSPCFLISASSQVEIIGNDIVVQGLYYSGALAMWCPTVDTLVLGQLAAGQYDLTAHFDYEGPFDSEGYLGSDTLSFVVGIPTNTASKELLEVNLNLFPNPAMDVITLAMNIGSPNEVNLEIYDAKGQLVATLNPDYMVYGEQIIPIVVSNLSNGFYLMKISVGNNNTISKRFIKQ
jgi:hypothetical protein